jgi:hypothetical protein
MGQKKLNKLIWLKTIILCVHMNISYKENSVKNQITKKNSKNKEYKVKVEKVNTSVEP